MGIHMIINENSVVDFGTYPHPNQWNVDLDGEIVIRFDRFRLDSYLSKWWLWRSCSFIGRTGPRGKMSSWLSATTPGGSGWRSTTWVRTSPPPSDGCCLPITGAGRLARFRRKRPPTCSPVDALSGCQRQTRVLRTRGPCPCDRPPSLSHLPRLNNITF